MTIYTDFPNDIEKNLFTRICKHQTKKHIYLSQFTRYGFSGAQLHIAYFSDKKNSRAGLPFIIKIGNEDKIKKEVAAIQLLNSCVDDCDSFKKAFYHKGRGAILFTHKGTRTADSAADTKTLAWEVWPNVQNKGEPTFSDDEVCKCLNQVFEKLKPAHEDNKVMAVKPADHYGWYVREAGKQRILSILGDFAATDRFEFVGAEIYNPIRLFDKLVDSVEVVAGHIHGDLHTDNIVLHDDGQPKLIDFEWANKDADILIDYVLLENSIRFQSFPKSVNSVVQLTVDRYLLEENGQDDILKDLTLPAIYLRLANILNCIRSGAKKALGDKFDFDNYLFTQYCLMCGLMAFDTYDQVMAMRALGLISNKIADKRKYVTI